MEFLLLASQIFGGRGGGGGGGGGKQWCPSPHHHKAYPGYEDEGEEDSGLCEQCQTYQSSVHLMITSQSKLHYCQQSQNDAVDVHNDNYLLGVVQALDLDPTSVEGHEHGGQLQEALVGVGDGQPHNGVLVQAHKHIVLVCDPFLLRGKIQNLLHQAL